MNLIWNIFLQHNLYFWYWNKKNKNLNRKIRNKIPLFTNKILIISYFTSHAGISYSTHNHKAKRQDPTRHHTNISACLCLGRIKGRIRLAQQAQDPNTQHVQLALVGRPLSSHSIRPQLGVRLRVLFIPEAKRRSQTHLLATPQILGHCHFCAVLRVRFDGNHRESFFCVEGVSLNFFELAFKRTRLI